MRDLALHRTPSDHTRAPFAEHIHTSRAHWVHLMLCALRGNVEPDTGTMSCAILTVHFEIDKTEKSVALRRVITAIYVWF